MQKRAVAKAITINPSKSRPISNEDWAKLESRIYQRSKENQDRRLRGLELMDHAIYKL